MVLILLVWLLVLMLLNLLIACNIRPLLIPLLLPVFLLKPLPLLVWLLMLRNGWVMFMPVMLV